MRSKSLDLWDVISFIDTTSIHYGQIVMYSTLMKDKHQVTLGIATNLLVVLLANPSFLTQGSQ